MMLPIRRVFKLFVQLIDQTTDATWPTSSYTSSLKGVDHMARIFLYKFHVSQSSLLRRELEMALAIALLLPSGIHLGVTQCTCLSTSCLLWRHTHSWTIVLTLRALCAISYPKLFSSVILTETTLFPPSNNNSKRKPEIMNITLGRRSSWASRLAARAQFSLFFIFSW